jgi:outer membrane immunogenic protein
VEPTYPQPPEKLYSVGRPLKPAKLYSVGTPVRPPVFDWSGFYIGANGSGNSHMLGQTERFKMTNAITNDFSDSSSAIGGGFEAGYLFPLWNNSFLVGLFGSVDFPNQSTNHTFGGGFLGQDTNVIGTIGPQIAFAVTPGVLFYGQAGVAVADVDQKLNFSGPVTSVNKTVTGASLGVGFAFQPTNLQVAGIPVSITAQYNRIFLPRTTFDNPGSPLFLYSNQSDIDQFKIGVRILFNPNTVAKTPIRF